MVDRRALVVDDSKSARAFLTRILERYELAVDGVESAEQAIEYLTIQQPDVIFMDHMMPGMDGFQAVQAIKNDSRTATIPIMMYTSQEGEVYLGQARALGAVGVLPKQIKHADVSKVLYQLHLIVDRRSSEQTTFKPLEAVIPHAAREGAGAVRDHESPDSVPSLRRWLHASLEAQTDQITAEIRAAQPGPRASGWPAGVAAVACAVALLAAGFWWGDYIRMQADRAEVTLLRQSIASRPAAAPAAAPGPAVSTAS